MHKESEKKRCVLNHRNNPIRQKPFTPLYFGYFLRYISFPDRVKFIPMITTHVLNQINKENVVKSFIPCLSIFRTNIFFLDESQSVTF